MFLKSKKVEAPIEPKFGVTQLHQAETFMNSERSLTPKMVSSLLNVSVLLQSENIHASKVEDEAFSPLSAVLIIITAIIVAVAVGTSFLYVHEIGPFYTKASATYSH